MACGLHCIRHELCISVNFAAEADENGHSCVLLKAERFRYPNKLNCNNFYHHYSLAVGKKFINVKNNIEKNSWQICFGLNLEANITQTDIGYPVGIKHTHKKQKNKKNLDEYIIYKRKNQCG